MKSELAGSKIPGLRVSNPKGLKSNKEGGEEEDQNQDEEVEIYREALRRGTKRLAYRGKSKREEEEEKESQELQEELGLDQAALMEAPEDRTWPWVKRRRAGGPWGQGWERYTPEKTSSPNVREPLSSKKGSPGGKDKCPEAQRPQTFAGLRMKQESISKFVVAVDRLEWR